MPHDDNRSTTPLGGALARLDRAREELAKDWLVRLIERASLDQIRELPTDRIAAELPELISDVLAAASGGADPYAMSPEARERAARLAELREGGPSPALEVARDVGAIQRVVLEALRRDAEELGADGFADAAARVADAVGAVQAAAAEKLLGSRSLELDPSAGGDPLTGLPDLAHLRQQVRQALALHERYEQPFALVALDVDGLKRVNDAHGRSAGDRVLVQVALALGQAIRTVDVPARIGGDEFCVLMPRQDAGSARALAERLAEAVGSEAAGGPGSGVGVTIGVVSCPEHGTEVGALLDAVDQAMYRAKASGDRVAVGDVVRPELTAERTS